MNDESATKSHSICARCGSDTVVSRGAGRALVFHGVTVELPEAFEYQRCHGCGAHALTHAQAEELRELLGI